jgi:hypothetical protein
MAITIQTYSISTDLSEITLEFELDSGDTTSSLLMWTEDTYKNSEESINLLSVLDGTSNTENVTISADDAGVSTFDGIYIIEIQSTNGNAVMAGASDFTQYYKVAAQLLSKLDLSCLSCNDDFQNSLLLDLYLQATINSLLLGRYQDAIEHLSKIKIVKEGYTECEDCLDIDISVSTSTNIVSVGIIDCQITDND